MNVYKEPVTDLGKKSKKGCLLLLRKGDSVYTKEECVHNQDEDSKKVGSVAFTFYHFCNLCLWLHGLTLPDITEVVVKFPDTRRLLLNFQAFGN